MEIPIISVTKHFDIFMNTFKHHFSHPQFKNCTRYILGLFLCEGKRTITHLHRSQTTKGSYNRLHHFVSDALWKHNQLNQDRIDTLFETVHEKAETINNPVGFFIGDDTTNPKRGRKMPGFGYHYSGVDDRPIPSQCVVNSLYHFQSFDIPLYASLYKNEPYCRKHNEVFKTKNELMIKQIKTFDFPRKIRTIGLFDSFYFNNDVLAECKTKSVDAIGRLKCNRRAIVSSDDPFGCRFDTWFHFLRTHHKHSFKRITVCDANGKKEQLWMYHWIGTIKNLGHVQLIMLTTKLRGKNIQPLFIATNAMDLSAEEIIHYYFKRWSIETFFWTIKNQLGFNHYQVRNEQATIRHWLLVFMAYSYLSLSKQLRDPTLSIGQLKSIEQQENFKNFIAHVYEKITKQRKNSHAIYLELAA